MPRRWLARFSFLLLLFTGLVLQSLAADSPLRSPRIIGGKDTTITEWPSLVAIVSVDDKSLFERQYCAGNLIAPNWVVTAAHCMFDGVTLVAFLPSEIETVLATTDLNDEPQERRVVSNIFVHPEYDKSETDSPNDIALLELANVTNQTPMALYSGEPAAGTMAKIVGWGATAYDNNQPTNFPTILQEADLPIVSNKTCNQPESYDGTIRDDQICAGFAAGGTDTCGGDSGGPLMAVQNGAFKQVGVVSFGAGCALPDKYGVYTRMSSFETWIEDFTGLDLGANGNKGDNGGANSGNGGGGALGSLETLIGLLGSFVGFKTLRARR